MIRLITLACAFTLFFCAFAEVIVLTNDNFDAIVDRSLPAFIEFYAPWCGHCKSLAPEYEKVGESFKPFQKQVIVAKVDCDANKAVCEKFGVTGYPTLKWFQNNDEPIPYQGERNADGIINFINQKTGLNARVKKDLSLVVDLEESNFEEVVLNSGKFVFVEFFAPWCGHCKTLAPKWDKLSAIFGNDKNVVIGKVDATKNEKLASKYGVSGYPTLFFFQPNDATPNKYEEARELDTLISFVNSKAGTDRKPDGTLGPNSGLVEELKSISSDFYNKAADVDTLIARAQETIKTIKPEDAAQAKLYVTFLERIKAKPQFLETETERLKKLVSGGSITPAKRDEFTKRLNILVSFNTEAAPTDDL